MSSTKNNLRSKSQAQNPDKLINIQRREKLKNLLIIKFMKKYGIKDPESLLQGEITNFLKNEQLNESDLKRLDEKIKALLSKKNEEENLRQDLSKEPSHNNQPPHMNKLVLPEIDNNRMENMSVKSKNSKMSGVSHLSKYSEYRNKENLPDDDRLSSYSQKNQTDRLNFNEEGDEWNAIAKYNQKMFQDEKKMSKYKDSEIKKRTKEELDTQVKEKLRRMNDENKKNNEYDNILLQHVDFLSNVEKNKQDDIKSKIYREKENRDQQLKDEKRRKRDENKKEKEFDKQLVQRLLEDMEREKQTIQMKKMHDKEYLKKVLIENEENKKKQSESLKKERDEDVKLCEEYGKVLDKQDKDRENYFKNKEKKSNEFSKKVSETVIKEMELRQKREEENIKKYQLDKELKEKEEDERKRRAALENKKEIKKFLDMQVDEKRKVNEFERSLNSEQAMIWKTDVQKFISQEQEINSKVKSMNVSNQEFLLNQISEKKGKKYERMNDHEYLLNRQILENAKTITGTEK